MTCNHGPAPSTGVLEAFGLTGTALPIAGGQGETFILTGQDDQQPTILKPTTNLEETEFLCSMQDALISTQPQAFRIAKPIPLLRPNTASVPALYYTAVSDTVQPTNPTALQLGWTATHYLPGEGDPKVNLPSLLPASRALHASLLALYPLKSPPPPCIAKRTDRWAYADRYAWDEHTLTTLAAISISINWPLLNSALNPLLIRLQSLLTPPSLLLNDPEPTVSTPQLMHGDLSGNLLFTPNDTLPPAIIDFSPYHRPAAYAEAIVAADLLLWRKGTLADLHILDPEDRLLASPGRVQLLVRAALFRLVTFAIDSSKGEGEAFMKRNFPLLDGEGTVKALERLIREGSA